LNRKAAQALSDVGPLAANVWLFRQQSTPGTKFRHKSFCDRWIVSRNVVADLS
jgi:hypothetical protein